MKLDLDEVRDAIGRFVTWEGATLADIAGSFCDVYGYTPPVDVLRESVMDLIRSGEVRRDGSTFYWHETDEHRIGPLTAAEWAEFRLRQDDDLIQCCGTTSDFRDAVFDLLRNGPETVLHHRTGEVLPAMVTRLRVAYSDMVDHGLPGGRGGELIDRLARFYLGDPPAPATADDRMHHDEVLASLCAHSGQTSVTVRPDRFAVCALPEGHDAYRYLVIHVELRRTDPDAGARWSVRWGPYIYVLNDDLDGGTWEVAASCPDGVDPDRWRHSREFPLVWALNTAKQLATEVDVNGRTAADIARDDRMKAI